MLVANVGRSAEEVAEALETAADGEAPTSVTLGGTGTKGRVAHATFGTERGATDAVTALRERPGVFAAFAELDEEAAPRARQPPPQPLPAVTSAVEVGVPGLALLAGFISEAEEDEVLRLVDEGGAWEHLAKRRVQHHGAAFSYATRGVVPGTELRPLPGWARALATRVERAARELGPAGADFPLDQITVNEYLPGVGISPHVDTHSAFEGTLAALSLAGGAAMQFRRGEERRVLFLPPRSLLVMRGEARYAWQHSLPHRHSDTVVGEAAPRARGLRRVSLTFRRVRTSGVCACAWPDVCDAQGGGLPPTRRLLSGEVR